jgi:hypothetical protein
MDPRAGLDGCSINNTKLSQTPTKCDIKYEKNNNNNKAKGGFVAHGYYSSIGSGTTTIPVTFR